MPKKTIAATSRFAALVAGCALVAVALPAPASAAEGHAYDGLVINEVYGGGGNSGAPFAHDFVELFNPTDEPIDLDPLILSYRSSAGGEGGRIDLAGEVAPESHFLVQLAAGSNTDAGDLPAPDQTGNIQMSATNGRVFLFEDGSGFDSALAGDRSGADGLVDMVGFGDAASYLVDATPRLGNATSASRTDMTGSNRADFAVGDPSPQNSGGEGVPEPNPQDPVFTIADAHVAADGTPVVASGVVTANWSGGLGGFVIQDPDGDPNDDLSDAIQVYVPAGEDTPAIGASVTVEAERDTFSGMPQLSSVASIDVLEEDLGDIEPITDWDVISTEAGKSAHRYELVSFVDEEFTVSDNYQLNTFGEFSVTLGGDVIYQPTAVIDPHDVVAIDAFSAEQQARTIVVDDARSTNFNGNGNAAFTYLTPDNPVRVGSDALFEEPAILDYRHSVWRLQPTEPIGLGTDGSGFVEIANDRDDVAEPHEIDGDITIANVNVLNYFPTTGREFVDLGLGKCTWYTDHEGTPIGNNRCEPNGPRGAATEESLERQQGKTVRAINQLDASILSLQELENSAAFGKDRDFAVSHFVDVLNEAAGEDKWEYVESAAELPVDEDVIRNAFIYQPELVEVVGESRVLIDDDAFHNAREPLFQAFKPAGSDDEDAFLVSANHFKSKGSGTDDGTGQGNANPDRVAQAEALVAFAAEVQEETGIDAVFHTGDFNAYAAEDPAVAIEAGGYTNLNYALNGGQPTYLFGGLSGSLDHIFANAQALDMVEDVDVWEINAQEQIGFEYSRYNYNQTLLFSDDVFRTSDHNPIRASLSFDEDHTPVDPVQAWEPGAVYTGGDTVSHGGAVWVAQWWTTEEPGASAWGAWMERGEATTCAAGDVRAWTDSWVYDGGDQVFFDGEVFEARWWTRGQDPETPWGPWQSVGAC